MRRWLTLALLLTLTPAAQAAPPETLHLVVQKSERRLLLYAAQGAGPERLVKDYRIALGQQPSGPKRDRGDSATPEGEYYVTHANPKSRFHLSLGLSYPNARDAEQGLRRGLITKAEQAAIAEALAKGARPPQDTKLGGDLFVHGGGTGSDWTLGCIALADADIDELFARVPVRTRVTIAP